MGKLIVHHGGRVTEHELADAPVVIGRDPQCDLFFADRKLSRQHARVEKEGSRFKLVDLASRNGSWINDERVDERALQPGDHIRLGGLKISFESGVPVTAERPGEETAFLSSEASADDAATVMLEPSVEDRTDATRALTPPPAEQGAHGPDDTSTVILSATEAVQPSDQGEETLERPPSPESTVVLPGELEGRVHDTGAMLLRAQADPELVSRTRAHLPAEDAPHERDDRDPAAMTTFYPPLESETESVRPVKTPSWSLRFALLAASMAVLAFLVLALPLMQTLGKALVEESKLRGRALLDVLAAANEAALGEGRLDDVSVNRVVDESGVSAAYVVDGQGAVVASSEDGERQLPLEGVESELAGVSRLSELEAANGDYVVAKPVSHRGRNVGVAVLRYRLPRGGSGWTTLVLVLGSLLMAIGVGAAVLVARRITLSPLKELSKDVAALRDGHASSVSVERPYDELSELARNLNDLLQSRGAETSEKPPGGRPTAGGGD